ncbi:microtubule-associated protein futsch [Copidosoma floridanum]|uniref:microtubule-associated protein futsch n=1 Tax=Copidosoma floridanum TaxID=29053 RepID=UPI0006C9C37A|nr:microtubule-associated protein futsch [Copidosoma floridanum]
MSGVVGDEGTSPAGGGGPTEEAGATERAPSGAGAPSPSHQQQQQQHPPPSPLSGCYLLVVLPEPHTAQHKDLILNRLAKGFLSWDKDSCHVDLEKELQALVAQAPEGEEARNGERLIQYATENLVTEVLIYPQSNTLLQCIRNLLASFTKHRHIIHAGYTFGGNGSWILQDGTFSLADFLDAFSEHEVQRVLRAYENSVTVDIHCAGVGDWSTSRLSKELCTKACRVRVNPGDVLTAGVPAITSFINYIGQYLIAQTLDQLMEPSDVVGNIRFSHPTLYVFPGGQGDAALFGINGFNMLVDGGFARKACFWDFARHLDRLDAVLITRINNSNVGGMSSVLRKKKETHVYPQIGHFFCNLVERRHLNSPDGDKDLDPLILDLIDIGQEMIVNLRHINLRPHPCYRDPEPINLYHKVGHGTLDMYVLSPSKDSREVREFMAKWNASESKLFAGLHRKDSNSIMFPIQNLVSICAMLVWQPANPEDTITRILFPGSTPQHKIFEGFERLKHLEFLKHPVCTAKSVSPSSSLVALKDKTAISKPKLSSIERETKRLAEIRREKKDISELKNIKKDSVIDENIAKTGKPTAPSQLKAEVKARKVVENKKIESEIKENKKIEKELKEAKKETKKIEKSERLDAETKKTEVAKVETEKTASAKDIKVQKIEKKKETKDSAVKTVIKSTKPESIIKPSVKSADRKPKLTVEKKDVIKSSPTTPKKTLNGTGTKIETSRTIVKSAVKTTSKISSATPAKSAKEANNRMVVEQKNIELTSMTSSSAPTQKVPLKPKPSERKSLSRRTKAMSPSKVRLALSPAKSTRSTPTASVKSEKDAVIRKVRGGTTDSSAVSTPSGVEPESAIKLIDKNLTEKSEDMSLDSIESKVLADLKEEREVVEEIEAVLQKAERIEEARKEERFEGDDEITAEATDKKDEDFTEEDITAEMDEGPKKICRKESQELTEEDEYLIVEKEEIYTEDSVQSGDAEHKHHLDEVESEKPRFNAESRSQVEEFEQQEEEDKDFAEEKKDEVPEKQLVESNLEVEKKKTLELSCEQKEQLKEEVEQIVALAMETVQKIEEKNASVKKDSEDLTKEPSGHSLEKLDSSQKQFVTEQKEQVPERMEESQERISTLESGATTTAPTLPEDERIPLDEIKEDVDEKHVVEQVKEKDVSVKQKDILESLPITPKPEIKELIVKTHAQHNVPRDVVKTPDEVADLPVHEEVDPKLYGMYELEKEKDIKTSTYFQDMKEQVAAPAKEQSSKGVLSFFGKVADKFEKGIDKLTKKARRDSDKDIEDKSSKSSSPKEIKSQEKIVFEEEITKPKAEYKEQQISTTISPATTEDEKIEKLLQEVSNTVVEDINICVKEADSKLINVKESFQDSLESLEEKVNEKIISDVGSKDVVKTSLTEAAEKLVDISTNIITNVSDADSKEPEKVKFIIPSNDDFDDDDDDSDIIARDFKEAVRDVAEVLVGTAGIQIEKEKPKDVEEIVKKVAEVLKEDDFLPKKISDVDDTSGKHKVTTDDFEIQEQSCIKIVKEKDITVYSPTKDVVEEDLMRICDDIMKNDILPSVSVIKSETQIETGTDVDVMVSGLEHIYVKEVAEHSIRDAKPDGEKVIMESEIGFDQKLSPGKAELVTVTPGSTPTSPKVVTEMQLPKLPSDYENVLNKDKSTESIIEEFIVTKKYKISTQVLEYLAIVKHVPKEIIIDDMKEIVSKFKIPYESAFDTSIEKYIMTRKDDYKKILDDNVTKEGVFASQSDEKTVEETSQVEHVNKRDSIHLEDEKTTKDIVNISSEEITKDADTEKMLPENFKIVDNFDEATDESKKVDKNAMKNDKILHELDQDVETYDVSETDTKEKYLDEAKEKFSHSDTEFLALDDMKLSDKIDLEIAKTQDSLKSGEISPAESVFSKSSTDVAKNEKSKSPSTEREVSEKKLPTELEIFEDKLEGQSKSPSVEKEISRENVSKPQSPGRDFSEKDTCEKLVDLEEKLAVDIKSDDKGEILELPSTDKNIETEKKSLSPVNEVVRKDKTSDSISDSIEKQNILDDKSKSPSIEREIAKKEISAEVLDIFSDSAVQTTTEAGSAKKEESSEVKASDDILKLDIKDDSKSPSVKLEVKEIDVTPAVINTVQPEIKDEKLKSPSAERDVLNKEGSPEVFTVMDEKIVKDITDVEMNEEIPTVTSPEKETKKITDDVLIDTAKAYIKDDNLKSPSVESGTVNEDTLIKSSAPSENKTKDFTETQTEATKIKSPTPEKSIDNDDKLSKDIAKTVDQEITSRDFKLPSDEKDVTKEEKLELLDTSEDKLTKVVKLDTEDKLLKVRSPEKDETLDEIENVKDEKSKSLSLDREILEKEKLPEESTSPNDTIVKDITTDVEKNKLKSMSPERDAYKKEKSPESLVTLDDKIKESTTEQDVFDDKSRSPSAEKEDQQIEELHQTPCIPVQSGHTLKQNIYDSTVKSPSVEKEVEAMAESRKTSIVTAEEDVNIETGKLLFEELRKTSVLTMEGIDAGSIIAEIPKEKSKSSSPEKESDKEDKTIDIKDDEEKSEKDNSKSKSPSIEREIKKVEESRKTSAVSVKGISINNDDFEVIQDKSTSATPEKESKKEETSDVTKDSKDVKSKSPSVEKEIESMGTMRKISATFEKDIITGGVESEIIGVKSKSPSPEKEAEKEEKVSVDTKDAKSKSPSVEKEIGDTGEKEIKSKSLSPTKEVEKEDKTSHETKEFMKSKSSSAEREIDKIGESRKTSAISIEGIHSGDAKSEMKEMQSKSPSLEKETKKEEKIEDIASIKSKSPSVEKETDNTEVTYKLSTVSAEDVIAGDVKSEIIGVVTSKSSSPEKESEKKENVFNEPTDVKGIKSKSPSAEKEIENTLESRKISVISVEDMNIVGVQPDAIGIKSSSPVNEAEKDGKTLIKTTKDIESKSPSVEREIEKIGEFRKISAISVEGMNIGDVKSEISEFKSKSISPEKEIKREEKNSDIEDTKSKSSSVEKEIDIICASRKTSAITVEDLHPEDVKSMIEEFESKSFSPEKEKMSDETKDIENVKSKSPSVEKEIVNTSRKASTTSVTDTYVTDGSFEKIVGKSKSPTPEKVEEKEDETHDKVINVQDITSKSPSIEKEIISESRKMSTFNAEGVDLDNVKSEIAVSKSPSPEKKTEEDDKIFGEIIVDIKDAEFKSQKVVEINVTGESRKTSMVGEVKSKSPSPAKELEKEAKISDKTEKPDIKDNRSKSPSIEKDIKKSEELRKMSITSLEVVNASDIKSEISSTEFKPLSLQKFEKTEKKSDVEIEDTRESDKQINKLKSSSVEKQIQEMGKIASTIVDYMDEGDVESDISERKSKSPSLEKDLERKEDKSKSPSVEKEIKKSGESRKTSTIIAEDINVTDATLEISNVTSKSPSLEIETGTSTVKNESKSPSPEKMLEKEKVPDDIVISLENQDIKDDKSKSPSIEKEAEYPGISRKTSLSPGNEAEKTSDDIIKDALHKSDIRDNKEIEKTGASRKTSAVFVESIDVSDLTSENLQIAPKSSSIEKEVRKKDISDDEIQDLVIPDIKDQSKSPSVEKEMVKTEKISEDAEIELDNSKSSSAERDVTKILAEEMFGKEKSPEIVGEPVMIHRDKSKSPSTEKEITKDSSPEKSVSGEHKEDTGFNISGVRNERSDSLSFKTQLMEEISKLEKNSSESGISVVSNVDSKSDKSKSPSVEKENILNEKWPTSYVEKDSVKSETSDKSKSPSVEKEISKKDSSLEPLSKAVSDRSKSPSVEKDTDRKEFPEKIIDTKDIVADVVELDIESHGSESESIEKQTEKTQESSTISTVQVVDENLDSKDDGLQLGSIEKKHELSETPIFSEQKKGMNTNEPTDTTPISTTDNLEHYCLRADREYDGETLISFDNNFAESHVKAASIEGRMSFDALQKDTEKLAPESRSSSISEPKQQMGDLSEVSSYSRDLITEKDVFEKSKSISPSSEKIESETLAQDFTGDHRASVSSIESHMGDKNKNRSRSQSFLDTENIEVTEEQTEEIHLLGEKFVDIAEEKFSKEIFYHQPLSPKTTKTIQDCIINEYINKKHIITLQVINELSSTYKIDRYIIMKIVNEIVAGLKTNREAILDFEEEEIEDTTQKMFDDQEKLVDYINEEFISKKRKISSTIVDEIAHANSVTRHLVILVIENIITSQNLKRESVVELDFCTILDPLEEELFKREGFKEESQSKRDASHDEYESAFHKAFIGGMTEIKTTHITTLSEKSTPDSGPRNDATADLTSENLSSMTTTITNVPEKIGGTHVEQSNEKLLMQTEDIQHNVIRTESVTVTKTTQITTQPHETKEIRRESMKSGAVVEGIPWQEIKSSVEVKQTSLGQSILDDIQHQSDLEEQLVQSTSIIRELITDDKSKSEKSFSTEAVSVGPKDTAHSGSTGKSTPDISMSPLIRDGSIMQSHLSGRSTPDKRSSDNRSRTATPEGFRSGDVIRTIITTTRTMSGDGEIITTTQEVTEATNEKGETIVLTEKTDVKVDEKLPESFMSDIKSIDTQRPPSPISDLTDKAADPTSPRSDLSSGHSRAATHVWGSSEERQTYSDEEPSSPALSSSPHHPDPRQPLVKEAVSDDFSGLTMTSSFYGELPSEIGHYGASLRKSPEIMAEQEEFSFGKFHVEKEYAGPQTERGSKKYVDEADLDFDKALESSSSFTQELSKSEHGKSGGASSTSPKPAGDKEDPLAGWGSPLGLPSPKAPRKFNLRSPVQPCSSADLSPDSLNFDAINDWGEPMRLPSPAPTSNEYSNKASPGTPKRDKKQAKKVLSENMKNKKRSESPVKNEKRAKDSKNKVQPIYMDLTYVSHHGNSFYTALEFFKKIRARYYVFSGTEPSREVYDALLEAKKTWEDKDLEVTMIPTYDTESLGYWVADNEEALAANHIDLSPSASRCTINLQDHETSCSAYRLEF